MTIQEFVDEATKDRIHMHITNDGPRNTTIVYSGTIKHEDDSTFSIIDTSKLQGNPSNLRLDGLTFMVESGLKCILQYKDRPYVIPVEGRGKSEFETLNGIVGKEIDLTLKGVGSFLIIVDISKMGV